ncbi:MAG TPA: helix-turn-helix transcriptional regulator [Tepidisphaeraceae bacterium]|jgi:transcriptional regulator with XRE-family HTH domain
MPSVKYRTMLDTAKLKRERENRGLSMAQAAKLCGMKMQLWQRIESGDGLSLTLRTLNRLASAFKMPPKSLLK